VSWRFGACSNLRTIYFVLVLDYARLFVWNAKKSIVSVKGSYLFLSLNIFYSNNEKDF
jgi:hypothetical protein